MENTERKTLTRGSVMFPARPQAAKQETSRQKGSTMPGYRKPRLAVPSRTGASSVTDSRIAVITARPS